MAFGSGLCRMDGALRDDKNLGVPPLSPFVNNLFTVNSDKRHYVSKRVESYNGSVLCAMRLPSVVPTHVRHFMNVSVSSGPAGAGR